MDARRGVNMFSKVEVPVWLFLFYVIFILHATVQGRSKRQIAEWDILVFHILVPSASPLKLHTWMKGFD